MTHKTFLEVMAGPDGIRLNHSQKRVIKKVLDAGDPSMAAEYVASAEDSRNLIGAAKILSRYGYIITEPQHLGQHDEPSSIELTDKGQQAAEEYDVQNDPTLVTPKEKEESAPTEQPPAQDPAAMGGEEMGMGGEEELQGQGVGLELSSFFHDVNDLARLKS